MLPFLKIRRDWSLGKPGKLNSESLEPPNFWRDWSLSFGEIGVNPWLIILLFCLNVKHEKKFVLKA